MQLISSLKTLAASAAFFVVAGFANAAVVATFDVEGDFADILNGEGKLVGASYQGTIPGGIDNIDDTAIADYEFSALLKIDGQTLIDQSVIFTNSSLSSVVQSVAFLLNPAITTAVQDIRAIVDANAGIDTTTEVIPGTFVSFESFFAEETNTATSGAFELYFGEVETPEFGGDGTAFSLELAINTVGDNVSPVPLPATLPLLLGAGLGLGAIARRRKRRA